MQSHTGVCGIFSGNDSDGYSYIVGSKHRDCKKLAEKLKEELSARGGGSPAMIQGSVAAGEEAIRRCLLK